MNARELASLAALLTASGVQWERSRLVRGRTEWEHVPWEAVIGRLLAMGWRPINAVQRSEEDAVRSVQGNSDRAQSGLVLLP